MHVVLIRLVQISRASSLNLVERKQCAVRPPGARQRADYCPTGGQSHGLARCELTNVQCEQHSRCSGYKHRGHYKGYGHIYYDPLMHWVGG